MKAEYEIMKGPGTYLGQVCLCILRDRETRPNESLRPSTK